MQNQRFGICNFRPLPVFALGLGAGIYFGNLVQRGTLILIGVCLFALCAVFAQRRKLRFFTVLFIAFALGLLRYTLAVPQTPTQGEYVLEGYVAEVPEYDDGQLIVLLSSAQQNEKRIEGRVQLRLKADDSLAEKLGYGDKLSVNARISVPVNTENFSARNYYLTQNINALAYARDDITITAHRNDLRGIMINIRQKKAQA